MLKSITLLCFLSSLFSPSRSQNISDLMNFSLWTFGVQTKTGDYLDLNFTSIAHHNNSEQHLQLRCFTDLCTKQNIDCSTFYLVSPANFSFLYGQLSLLIKLPAAGSSYSSIQLWPFRCRSTPCSPASTTYVTFELFYTTPNTIYYTLHYQGASGSARMDKQTSQRSRTSPESSHTIEVVSSVESLLWKLDGVTVASFTNQLSLPKEPMNLQFVKSCSSEGMQSLWDPVSVLTVDDIKFQQSFAGSRKKLAFIFKYIK